MFLYRLRNNSFKHFARRHLKTPWRAVRRLPDKVKLHSLRLLAQILPSTVTVRRDTLYPPARFSQSTADWMRSRSAGAEGSFREVDDACQIRNPLPRTVHEAIRHQFLSEQIYAYPATFVVTIQDGRVWGDGIVVTPDDYVLGDVSVDFQSEAGRSSIARRWRYQPITECNGAVLVLSTDGGGLYYHWLLQLLPRFELARRANIDLANVEYVLVNDLGKPFQRESMEVLGIDKKQIIQSSQVPYLRAKKLIVPSIPLGGGCFRPWMCQFLRSSFLGADSLKSTKRPDRRLYISRRLASYRRVLNELEVLEVLRHRGFEEISFETMSVREQAAAMASCEAVISPHGGGLSNLIFCSPGTKVVEFFSPESVIGFFWKLSNQMGLDYYYFLGKGRAETRNSDYKQSWETLTDIDVDLDTLRMTLDLAKIT